MHTRKKNNRYVLVAGIPTYESSDFSSCGGARERRVKRAFGAVQ